MRVPTYKFDGHPKEFVYTVKGLNQIIENNSIPKFGNSGNPKKSYINIPKDIYDDIRLLFSSMSILVGCTNIMYYKGYLYLQHRDTIFISTFHQGFSALRLFITKSKILHGVIVNKAYEDMSNLLIHHHNLRGK